jgi:hypothetical protein
MIYKIIKYQMIFIIFKLILFLQILTFIIFFILQNYKKTILIIFLENMNSCIIF